jgi:hypothetical protein
VVTIQQVQSNKTLATIQASTSMGASSKEEGPREGSRGAPNQDRPKPLQCSAQPIISSFHVTGQKGEARIQSSRTVHPSMAGMPRLSSFPCSRSHSCDLSSSIASAFTSAFNTLLLSPPHLASLLTFVCVVLSYLVRSGPLGTSLPFPGSAAAMLAQVLLVHLLLLPATYSADHHRHYRGRRSLHEPLFPLESTPALPPPPPAPFFPFLPGAAAPPTPEVGSASAPADTGAADASSSYSSPHPTAPANISSLAALPVSHAAPLRSFLSSHRLLTVLVLVVAVAAAVLTAALVYILARRQRRHPPKEEPAVYTKPSSLAQANPVVYDGGDQRGRGSTATVSSTSSPELRPMPHLNLLCFEGPVLKEFVVDPSLLKKNTQIVLDL